MNESLEFRVRWLERIHGSPAEREAFGEVEIRWGDVTLTELEDRLAATVRPGARLSVLHLGTWLASNWWRLRWEPMPSVPDVDWKLSHQVGAAGGGFLWPALQFASDGERVAFSLGDTPSAGQPVRYLRRVEGSVSAVAFERAVDELMTLLLGRLTARQTPVAELAGLWEEVGTERLDPIKTSSRRREALLGLDPDAVPAERLAAIHSRGTWMGEAALEETMVSARIGAIEKTIDRLRDWSMQGAPNIDLCALDDVLTMWRATPRTTFVEPWERGAALAKVVRQQIGLSSVDPVPSRRLADLLGHDVTAGRAHDESMAAGFRSPAAPLQLTCFLNRRHPTSRRFEAARLIADALDGPVDDTVLPITECFTARQRVQRSFAQEFLCPTEALRQILPLPYPSDGLIEDTAGHFEVSEFTVRNALVNRGLVDRGYLPCQHRGVS